MLGKPGGDDTDLVDFLRRDRTRDRALEHRSRAPEELRRVARRGTPVGHSPARDPDGVVTFLDGVAGEHQAWAGVHRAQHAAQTAQKRLEAFAPAQERRRPLVAPGRRGCVHLGVEMLDEPLVGPRPLEEAERGVDLPAVRVGIEVAEAG